MTNHKLNKGLAIFIMICFLAGIPGKSLALKLSDKEPPQLLGASVIGTVLTLEFDELIRSIPACTPGLFTVKVNGVPQTSPRSAVAVLKTVILNLAQTANPSDRITISYQSGDRGIEDLAGNKSASFEDFMVSNHTPDLIPPILQEAIVNGTDFYLSYNEALDENSLPNNLDYSILINGQDIIHPDEINIAGAKVNLRLASAVAPTDRVKISYATITHPVRDLAGNPALPLVLHPAQNISGQDITPPHLQKPALIKKNSDLSLTRNLMPPTYRLLQHSECR